MANPRMIFTISEEARDALKRVAKKTSIPESDLMRQAMADLLAKYGETSNVDVDRGGYRGGPKEKRQTDDQ
jgi:translation initiation factor 2 alpha subunit (eIF-2alpha)